MTIQELADAHVGHPEEIDEDSVITAQRESFKWGALHVLKEIEDVMPIWAKTSVTYGSYGRIWDKIQELKGDL